MPTTVDQLRADIETLRSTVRQLQAAYFQAIQGSQGNLPGTSDLSSVDQEVTDLNAEVQQILSGSTVSNPNLPPSSNPPSSGPSTPTQPGPVDPTQAPPSSQPPAVDPNQGQQGATQGTQVNLAPVGAAPSTPMTTPAGQASLTPSQGGQPAAANPSSADRVPVASA